MPKNRFWGRNFKNLCLDSESALPLYHVCQFLVEIDNLLDLNLGKLPNDVRYGIAEGWVEAEMSWVEFEMSWVEVDGAGWRWMHGLAIPELN